MRQQSGNETFHAYHPGMESKEPTTEQNPRWLRGLFSRGVDDHQRVLVCSVCGGAVYHWEEEYHENKCWANARVEIPVGISTFDDRVGPPSGGSTS